MNETRGRHLIMRREEVEVRLGRIITSAALEVLLLVWTSLFIIGAIDANWWMLAAGLAGFMLQKVFHSVHDASRGVCVQCGGTNRPAGVLFQIDGRER